ncbi:ParB/RepB/Spo0J family partition protein [Marinobacterium stanieri]|uniref:ParB-like nuclease domain-containing protein n=1 Tax=Marinobacterium stanieri TaxID=49186 RepID=A0A1N6XK61_9GAMM|nr:ParB N-terminal domain-containing protein [Marinobacterium stanieri]SIR02631.1 ParB-like nuclease domain-containing protein [Marinobacterium stanieri]
MLLATPAKKPKTKESRTVQRGRDIDSGLGSALNTATGSLMKQAKVALIPLEQIKPNPRNSRKLKIPLEVMIDSLKLGTEESLVRIDAEGDLNFPEISELEGLGLNELIENKACTKFYAGIRDLALSIHKNVGLLQPAEVSKIEGGVLLNIGHRRWYAYQILSRVCDLHSMPCLLKDGAANLEGALRRWDENEQRDDLNLSEKLRDYETIMEQFEDEQGTKPSQADMVRMLSISRPEASHYARIINANLEPDEIELIEDYGLNDLRTVAEVCRLQSKADRSQAFEVYVDKGNTAARNFVKAKQTEPKKGQDSSSNVPPSELRPRLRKVAPSPVAVSGLVNVLKSSAPHLLADLNDDVTDPAAILEHILSVIESEASA